MYVFGKKSRDNLEGVDPDLVRLAHGMLFYSPLDVRITCGLRTRTEQEALVKAGKSRTMNSRHLTGGAFDFVPLVGGKDSWSWDDFYVAIEALRAAAIRLDIPAESGALWGQDLRKVKGPIKAAVEAYSKEYRAKHGKAPFLDGPHVQKLRA